MTTLITKNVMENGSAGTQMFIDRQTHLLSGVRQRFYKMRLKSNDKVGVKSPQDWGDML